jgi:hypothetical protein
MDVSKNIGAKSLGQPGFSILSSGTCALKLFTAVINNVP